MEDPELAKQRDEAEKRRDRLIQASGALSNIPVHYFAISSVHNDAHDEDASADENTVEEVTVATIPTAPGKDSQPTRSTAGATTVTPAPVPVPPPTEEVVSTKDGKKYLRIPLTLHIGQNGMGVIVSDNKVGQLVVTGFREMPGNEPNPSIEAGMAVGDILERINGSTPKTVQEAGTLLRSSKGAVPLAILRLKR